ncbi:MAG: HU family DNA-binding protein, partial [Planctomycetota bacterium]
MAKAAPKKPPTKTEIYASIAESTGLTKRDVSAVFDALNDEIAKALGKKGPQSFTMPGLCKIVVQHKPAAPARKGVPNPFRPGELMDVAAKP